LPARKQHQRGPKKNIPKRSAVISEAIQLTSGALSTISAVSASARRSLEAEVISMNEAEGCIRAAPQGEPASLMWMADALELRGAFPLAQ
jgi:hypothetical protein